MPNLNPPTTNDEAVIGGTEQRPGGVNVTFQRSTPVSPSTASPTTVAPDEPGVEPDGSAAPGTSTSRNPFSRGGGPKKVKPMSPAAKRRALDTRRRKMRLGNRYGGDRWKRRMLEFALFAGVALGILALVVAVSKPSKDQIAGEVTAQLESSGVNFPSGEAVMWAGQALRVWGTWDEKNPDSRAVLLAPYLSQGMDKQAGWNGKGKQQVIYSSMNPEPQTIDASHAIVTAAYQRGDQTWACVALPVYAYHPKEFSGNAPWAFALAGNPTPTACNPRTGAVTPPSQNTKMKVDTDLGRTLSTDFFPGFFSAWAASDANALTQYTASGVTTMGLGGAMASVPPPSIGGDASVLVDDNGAVEGRTYIATVPVTWTVANSTSQVSAVYSVPMVKNGDRWYVAGEPVASPVSAVAASGQPGAVPQPGDGISPEPLPGPSTSGPPSAPATVDPTTGTPTPSPPETEGSR